MDSAVPGGLVWGARSVVSHQQGLSLRNRRPERRGTITLVRTTAANDRTL